MTYNVFGGTFNIAQLSHRLVPTNVQDAYVFYNENSTFELSPRMTCCYVVLA